MCAGGCGGGSPQRPSYTPKPRPLPTSNKSYSSVNLSSNASSQFGKPRITFSGRKSK